MKILVVNAGSSSLKYQLIDMKMRALSQRATVNVSVLTVRSHTRPLTEESMKRNVHSLPTQRLLKSWLRL